MFRIAFPILPLLAQLLAAPDSPEPGNTVDASHARVIAVVGDEVRIADLVTGEHAVLVRAEQRIAQAVREPRGGYVYLTGARTESMTLYYAAPNEATGRQLASIELHSFHAEEFDEPAHEVIAALGAVDGRICVDVEARVWRNEYRTLYEVAEGRQITLTATGDELTSARGACPTKPPLEYFGLSLQSAQTFERLPSYIEGGALVARASTQHELPLALPPEIRPHARDYGLDAWRLRVQADGDDQLLVLGEWSGTSAGDARAVLYDVETGAQWHDFGDAEISRQQGFWGTPPLRLTDDRRYFAWFDATGSVTFVGTGIGPAEAIVVPANLRAMTPIYLPPGEPHQATSPVAETSDQPGEGDAFRLAILTDTTWDGVHEILCGALPAGAISIGDGRWLQPPPDWRKESPPPALGVCPPGDWLPPIVTAVDAWAHTQREGYEDPAGAEEPGPRYTHAMAIDYDGDGMREAILFGAYRASRSSRDAPGGFVTLVDYSELSSSSPTLSHFWRVGSGGYWGRTPVRGSVRWQDVDGDGAPDLVFRTKWEGYEGGSSGHSALVGLPSRPHWLVFGVSSSWGEAADFSLVSATPWLTSVQDGRSVYVCDVQYNDSGLYPDVAIFLGGPDFGMDEVALAEISRDPAPDVTSLPLNHNESPMLTQATPVLHPLVERPVHPGATLWTAELARGDWRDLRPVYEALLARLEPTTLSDGTIVPSVERLRLLLLGVQECIPNVPVDADALEEAGATVTELPRELGILDAVLILDVARDATLLDEGARALLGGIAPGQLGHGLAPQVHPLIEATRTRLQFEYDERSGEPSPPTACPPVGAD
jgi:hypothetical protein